MQEALQGVRLRQHAATANMTGQSDSTPTVSVVDDSVDSGAWFASNLENWYSTVQDFTFRTEFIEMTREQKQIIVELCNRNIHSSDYTTPSPPQVPDALQSISDKIDSIIASFPAHAAMCKLSSRSPKNAAITSQKMNQLVESRLPRIYMTTASLTPTEIDNEKLKILFQSLMESMCVTSGREAMMIMTCSGRVLEDLQMSLEHPNEAPMNIVLREWKRFSVSCEWRGFVHGKTLVALSQYFDTCYFQDVAINKEKIVLTIQTFFDTKLKHRIPLENYIIDFAVAPDWTEVLIIELNPWLPTTDSCLFNWTKDHAVLYGKAPFQARIVEAPLRGLKHHVLSMWHHYFD